MYRGTSPHPSPILSLTMAKVFSARGRTLQAPSASTESSSQLQQLRLGSETAEAADFQ